MFSLLVDMFSGVFGMAVLVTVDNMESGINFFGEEDSIKFSHRELDLDIRNC